MIVGVHHFSRVVSDMRRSLSFYRDILDLRVVVDEEMEGEVLSREVALEGASLRLVELAIPGTEALLELLEYHSPDARLKAYKGACADTGAHHLALVVDDIEYYYRELTNRGVRFSWQPQRIADGSFRGDLTAYCYDPDDLVVELWQRGEGESAHV
jgi:catechol 2,3-dioxygenase-like lactoylglutathione lyase family enzyme